MTQTLLEASRTVRNKSHQVKEKPVEAAVEKICVEAYFN